MSTTRIFHKMHSLGNDFMVLDCVSNPQSIDADLVRSWSDRKLGIGFDQLLVIAPPTLATADFDYQIFNADGTQAQQCGNGTRCVAYLAHHLGLSNNNHLLWNSAGGMIETTLHNAKHIQTLMPAPILEHKHIPFVGRSEQLTEDMTVCEQTFCVTPVSMGNPHGVIFVDSLVDLDVEKIGGEMTRIGAADGADQQLDSFQKELKDALQTTKQFHYIHLLSTTLFSSVAKETKSSGPSCICRLHSELPSPSVAGDGRAHRFHAHSACQ